MTKTLLLVRPGLLYPRVLIHPVLHPIAPRQRSNTSSRPNASRTGLRKRGRAPSEWTGDGRPAARKYGVIIRGACEVVLLYETNFYFDGTCMLYFHGSRSFRYLLYINSKLLDHVCGMPVLDGRLCLIKGRYGSGTTKGHHHRII